MLKKDIKKLKNGENRRILPSGQSIFSVANHIPAKRSKFHQVCNPTLHNVPVGQ